MGWMSTIGKVLGGSVGTALLPGIGTAIGAGLGGMAIDAISGGGKDQINSAYATNQLQIEEAKRNRDFQERMTKNKHTYEVADLKNAGLNPILSAHSGASVPSGSLPGKLQNPKAGQLERKIALMGAMAQIKQVTASARKLNADSDLTIAKTPKQDLIGGLYRRGNQVIKTGENSAKSFMGRYLTSPNRETKTRIKMRTLR